MTIKKKGTDVSEAVRRAAEAAKRAEAARRAAEAAKRAAEAAARKPMADPKALAEKTAKRATANAVRQTLGHNEFSTGAGRALRQFGAALNGKLTVASTLRTEVRGDGNANCLERATNLAKPGDRVVLMEDRRDGVGHAVVQRPDGSIIDPNAPNTPVKNLETWQRQNPRYSNPVSVSDRDAEAVLKTPPGVARDVLLSKLGLNRVADLRVADPAAPSATTPAARAAADVASAYETGGADAAAAKLEEVTEGLPADEVAAINQAAQPTIDRVITDLGRRASDADGSQDDHGDQQVAFDQTVADLNISLARGLPEGQSSVDAASAAISRQIQDHGIGRWDEALGNTALGGPNAGRLTELGPDGLANADTTLATAVIDQLNSAGKTDQADDILQNVTTSVDQLNDVTGDLAGKVDEYNADLAVLVQEWGQFATSEEDVQAAIEAFKASHPEYAQLEALAGGAIKVTDQLDAVPGRFSNLGHADDLDGQLDRATDKLPQLLETNSGGAAAATLDENQGLLSRVSDLAKAGKKDLKYLERLSGQIVKLTMKSALEAGDDAARHAAIAKLNSLGPIFGIDAAKMNELTEALDDVALATDATRSRAALEHLDETLEGMGGGVFKSGTMGQVIRGSAFVLAGVAVAGDISKAIDDPSFQNMLSAFSSSSGTLAAGADFARSFFSSTRALANLGNATKFLGAASGAFGVALSVFQAQSAFRSGDPALGGLYAAQAAGGLLSVASAVGVVGGPAGWVGAGIMVGAALAIGQLQKVRASNRFEDGHTQAFLEALGVPESVSYHLRNADSEGRMVGTGLVAVAEQLGIEPRALFDQLAGMKPEDVLKVVETLHGIDPHDDGSFTMTDDSDARAGEMNGRQGRLPAESIQGAINYLETAYGITFET